MAALAPFVAGVDEKAGGTMIVLIAPRVLPVRMHGMQADAQGANDRATATTLPRRTGTFFHASTPAAAAIRGGEAPAGSLGAVGDLRSPVSL